MKPEELMIGDWVHISIGENDWGNVRVFPDIIQHLFHIENVPQRAILSTYDSKMKVEPVPITVEILEKNGFSGEGYNMGVIGIKKEDTEEESGYHIYRWSGGFIECKSGLTHVKKRMKYVHELQHAIKFCEIEKEIKL